MPGHLLFYLIARREIVALAAFELALGLALLTFWPSSSPSLCSSASLWLSPSSSSSSSCRRRRRRRRRHRKRYRQSHRSAEHGVGHVSGAGAFSAQHCCVTVVVCNGAPAFASRVPTAEHGKRRLFVALALAPSKITAGRAKASVPSETLMSCTDSRDGMKRFMDGTAFMPLAAFIGDDDDDDDDDDVVVAFGAGDGGGGDIGGRQLSPTTIKARKQSAAQSFCRESFAIDELSDETSSPSTIMPSFG